MSKNYHGQVFRQGALAAPHDRVKVSVIIYSYVRIEYVGTLEELILAGCIAESDASTPAKTGVTRRGKSGDRFAIRKRPTKGKPGQVFVAWSVKDCARALALPGVGSLFPAGIIDDRRESFEKLSVPDEPAPQPVTSEHVNQDELQKRAAVAADVFGVTNWATRKRIVGRFRRAVSWASIECLIIPDWGQVRLAAAIARTENGAA